MKTFVIVGGSKGIGKSITKNLLVNNKVIIKKPYDFEAFKDYFSEIKAIKSKD